MVVLVLLFALALATSITSVPPPAGREAALVADAQDGKLNVTPLLDAALIASGVADGDVPMEAAKVRAVLAPAIERARDAPVDARGDALLRALHETVLRKYVATASEIDDVARTGEFNCLSSALLYVVAADGLVDNPRAMVSKHHAYARVAVNGRSVDVETTSPDGFNADRNAMMTPAYVTTIAGPGISPRDLLEDLRSSEELPILSHVAGVYSNRAVALAARGDLARTAIALDRATRLASGGLKARATAWRAGVLNNGALALAGAGRLEDARALLELALDGVDDGTKRLLLGNLTSLHLQAADAAMTRGDWTGALAAVAAAEELGSPSPATSAAAARLRARANAELAALDGDDKRCHVDDALEASTCFSTLARSLRESDFDAALQHARRAYALAPQEPNAARALFFTLVGKARAEADRGSCDAVEALAREAAPRAAALEGQRFSADEVAASCWARLGDAAFDKKDWAASSRSYERATTHLPRDAALRQNMAAVDVNRAIELAAAGRCDDARPFAQRAVQRDRGLGLKAAELLESCAAVRAKDAADHGDFSLAAAELRRGLRDAPTSILLKETLGAILHNIAVRMLRENNCSDALALLPELRRAHQRDAADAIRASCERCAGCGASPR
jgi:hypothetical protein